MEPLHEQYKATAIKDMPSTDCKMWVMDEITGLANDFGQKIDNELLKHMGKRTYAELNTRYRSWAVGTIHAAFQSGMSGAYGVVHKVTVQRLFQWLRAAAQQHAVKSALISERQPRTAPDVLKVSGNDYGSFLCFLTKNKIWVESLVPGWDFTKKEVPQKLRDLASEFAEAQEMDMLPSFKFRLLNPRTEA